MKTVYLSILWSLWFLVFSSRTALSPFLPIIEDELHLSHALAGGFYLSISLGYTLSLILSGIVAPKVGYKRLIVIGTATLVLSAASCWLAKGYVELAVILFFVGIAGGLYIPGAIPLLTGLFEPRNWGKTIAVHDTAASVSILSIPFLTTLSLVFTPWRGFFVLMAVAGVLCLAAFVKFVPDAPPNQGEERGSIADILKRGDFWIMFVLWMVAATATMGLYSITPLFLVTERGIPLESANTIFGISRIGSIFATLIAGFLVDRFGSRKLIFWIIVISGASTLGVAAAPNMILLFLALSIQAPFSNGFFPVGLVAVSKLSNPGERSLFTGVTISGGTIVGMGIAPVLLGAIADRWSFELGFVITGIVILSAAALPLLLKDI